VDKLSCTALICAAFNVHASAVSMILTVDASIDAASEDVAAANVHDSIVSLLTAVTKFRS
jgi:hypothetical protein